MDSPTHIADCAESAINSDIVNPDIRLEATGKNRRFNPRDLRNAFGDVVKEFVNMRCQLRLPALLHDDRNHIALPLQRREIKTLLLTP